MIRRFIHDLGGPKAVAEWLAVRGRSVKPDTISAWGLDGRHIPWKWRLLIWQMAREKGVDTFPEDLKPFVRLDAAETARSARRPAA